MSRKLVKQEDIPKGTLVRVVELSWRSMFYGRIHGPIKQSKEGNPVVEVKDNISKGVYLVRIEDVVLINRSKHSKQGDQDIE